MSANFNYRTDICKPSERHLHALGSTCARAGFPSRLPRCPWNDICKCLRSDICKCRACDVCKCPTFANVGHLQKSADGHLQMSDMRGLQMSDVRHRKCPTCDLCKCPTSAGRGAAGGLAKGLPARNHMSNCPQGAPSGVCNTAVWARRTSERIKNKYFLAPLT